jgi:ERCC4-type nuclease
MITACMIDSREPEWVQNLKFGGVPTVVTLLDAGDIWAVTDDGHTLMIERKTPDDFLNTLRDERLFPQLTRLAEKRQEQQEKGEKPTYWPYLVITDEFKRNGQKVYTERETGWSWSSLQGALLTIQEMGVMVVTCGGDSDFEPCVIRLGERNRSEVLNLLPPRQPIMWGPKEAFIAALPGIGPDKTLKIMTWADNNLFYALMGLTDLSMDCPVEGVGKITRQKIRDFLGLSDKKTIEMVLDEASQNFNMKEL